MERYEKSPAIRLGILNGASSIPTWQGKKDSNPQQRFWRPTCYHYTIPLRNEIIITELAENVNHKFPLFSAECYACVAARTPQKCAACL